MHAVNAALVLRAGPFPATPQADIIAKPEEIVPPAPYSGLWLILGITLVIAVGLWLFFVFFSTRKTLTAPEIIAKGKDPYLKYRKTFMHRIDTVDAQYRNGELDNRNVHLELSRLVRQFAQETRGISAETATLTELREVHGDGPLTSLIEAYYHPEFAETSTAEAPTAVAAAREVISSW